MIKVLYDGSILGRAQLLPLARSGIFRYADQLLRALVSGEECRIALTSFGYSLDAAGLVEYHARNPNLSHDPLVLNPAIRIVGGCLHTAMGLAQSEAKASSAPTSVLRKLHQTGDGLLASLQQQYRPGLGRQVRDIDVFHTPFLHIPPVLRRLPHIGRVVTVHDLNPISDPQYFPAVVCRWSRKIMQNIAADDWVITVSQHVKNELCSRFPVSPERVHFTPLAADVSIFQPCSDRHKIQEVHDRYGIPRQPYILTLGSVSPHKNVTHLVRCFARIAHEPQAKDLHLVIAGTNGWMMEELTRMIGETGPASQRIHLPGFIHDEDQAALYSAATAFVFPSLCEGFGLPPLEAMQCGTPVISSRATSLPEVVGSAGILVDPRDEDALCQAILDVHNNAEFGARLRHEGIVQSRRFSWQRCASETVDVYRLALQAR